MSVYVSDNAREYETAPEGLYPAVCIDVVDLGKQQTPWGEKHQVEIRWALGDRDSRGLQFIVRRRYTASLNEKAALRQHLELWRGKKFAAYELKGFDLEVLVGKACQVQVVHTIKEDGRTFANVQAVIAAAKGTVGVPVPSGYVREADRAKQREPDPFQQQEDYRKVGQPAFQPEDYGDQGEEEDDAIPF